LSIKEPQESLIAWQPKICFEKSIENKNKNFWKQIANQSLY